MFSVLASMVPSKATAPNSGLSSSSAGPPSTLSSMLFSLVLFGAGPSPFASSAISGVAAKFVSGPRRRASSTIAYARLFFLSNAFGERLSSKKLAFFRGISQNCVLSVEIVLLFRTDCHIIIYVIGIPRKQFSISTFPFSHQHFQTRSSNETSLKRQNSLPAWVCLYQPMSHREIPVRVKSRLSVSAFTATTGMPRQCTGKFHAKFTTS